MKKPEKKLARRWINHWKTAEAELKKVAANELREMSLAETILALSDASESALALYPPPPTSGMIEMQRLFAKFKNDEADY